MVKELTKFRLGMALKISTRKYQEKKPKKEKKQV
jgi:hypothetical protein